MWTIRPCVRSSGLGGLALRLLTGVTTGLARAGCKTLLVLALAGRDGQNAQFLFHFVNIFLSAPSTKKRATVIVL